THRWSASKRRSSMPSVSSLEPIQRYQRTRKGEDVQGFSKPCPKRPPGDPRREGRGWGHIQRHLLKGKHLRDEKQAAPPTYDEIGDQGHQEQATHGWLTPGPHQHHKDAEGDGPMHRDPEPLQR